MPNDAFDLTSLTPPLEDTVGEWLQKHAAQVAPPDLLRRHPRLRTDLPGLLAGSAYVGDCLARYPDMLAELLSGGRLDRALEPGELDAAFATELQNEASEADVVSGMRRLRHRELVRIVWRDLVGGNGYDGTLQELSALADAAINRAHAFAVTALDERYGRPRDAHGREIGFGIIAMGKLGGQELNFSSDVDLVFVFETAGMTDGRKSVSTDEYFRLLGQRIVTLLSQKTSDGFVYRVDVRLRPFGESGPLAVSLSALEEYLLQYGRDWERYAYIKARVVNRFDASSELYDEILRPFIYRRYIDYGVFNSLRDMKAMIDAEVRRKEFRDNIKLGLGGIREIEFIAQSLQLVRGGTDPELRQRRLVTALRNLVAAECLPAEVGAELESAYEYLRLVENRLQAIQDRQTHDIPGEALARARLAYAMDQSWDELSEHLERQRTIVAGHFRNILFRGGDDEDTQDEIARAVRAWIGGAPDETLAAALDAMADAEAILEALRRFRDGGCMRRLDDAGLQRLSALLPDVITAAAAQDNSSLALEGTLSVIEAIGRRSAYFALLNENPDALGHLVRLCAQSEFLSKQLATHPLLLDELLDQRVFLAAPMREEMQADLTERLAAAGDDPEQRHHALLNFKQAATFRVAVSDLSGGLPLMKVSDRLTDIAELSLQAALDMSWADLTRRHGKPTCRDVHGTRDARFAIIAYGKLGGLELGYGSDLDLVFLHDSDGEAQHTDGDKPVENSVFFIRLARRIIHVLTMVTNSGSMYEVDMRLRPSGRSGMLVSSLVAFDHYQREDAWTWEHQALLRSRAAAGDETVREAFEALRVKALREYVRRDSLRDDVVDMRRRMREELSRGTAKLFDLKQSLGGVTDIEFIVQYLVLKHAAEKPELVRYSDNIRQLEALVAGGLLSGEDGELLADLYRAYRRRMHRLSLRGVAGLVERDSVATDAASVKAIWQSLFS